MSKKATPTDLSSSDFNDETSSSEGKKRKSPRKTTRRTSSIKNYVTDILTKQQDGDDHQRIDLTQTQMKIKTSSDPFRKYENISAFRRYQPTTDTTTRTDPQQQQQRQSSSSDDELKDHTLTEEVI